MKTSGSSFPLGRELDDRMRPEGKGELPPLSHPPPHVVLYPLAGWGGLSVFAYLQ